MPIRPEAKRFYPDDWREISDRIRFGRANGRCEKCGRPHGSEVPQLVDGRWMSPGGTWMDDDGRMTDHPDLVSAMEAVRKRIVVATAHLDHDPRHVDDLNLMALCGRCHLRNDRPEHARRRRFYKLKRLALGDLFDGRYPAIPFIGLEGD